MRTLIAVILLLATAVFSQIQWQLDEFGLSRVTYNNQLVMNDSKTFFCFGVTFTYPNGTNQFVYQDQSYLNTPNRTLDEDGNGILIYGSTYKYHCRYSSPVADEFLVSCEVTNLHPEASLSGFSFALMRQMRPPQNVTYSNRGSQGYDEAAFSVVYSDGGKYSVGIYPTSYAVPSSVQTSTNYDYYSVQSQWRPRDKEDYVAIGDTTTMEYIFKFGSLEATADELCAAAQKAFRDAYPMTLNWPNRRPILTHFASSGGSHSSATNPRGWFNDETADFVSEEGRANFKTRLIESAQTVVNQMQMAKAQGMILWDMEGNELPHAITYIGDPVNAEKIAPELVGAIDEYFKTITDAGFECGMTIRPQQMEWGADVPQGPCVNNSVYIHYDGPWQEKGYTCINDVYYISLPYFQPPGGDPTEIMIAKMKYAKDRWGCKIFYVDSNAPPGGWAYPSDVHERVLEAVPGILVLPEQEFPRYFRSMAPYGEIDMNIWFVNVESTAIYPEAFAAVNVQDGTLYEDLLIESTLRGNVFISRGWFADTRTEELLALLEQVERDHPYEVSGDGSVDGYAKENIAVSVSVSAERMSGITFDWRVEGGSIQQSYRQYLSTIDVVYDAPGTYTVTVIVRRGITEKTHDITVNVMAQQLSGGNRSNIGFGFVVIALGILVVL